MIYQPDLDIYTVEFTHDENFFYFTINLYGLNEEKQALTGMYGVEFDRTLTGRGDLLVWAEAPTDEEWSIENLTVYTDANEDVGGPKPTLSDEDFEGDGYDTVVELAGDRAAFARLEPGDPEAVQFAVSRMLLDNPMSSCGAPGPTMG